MWEYPENRRSPLSKPRAEGGGSSGGIGSESESSDRSYSSNPGDENSTGGEAYDGGGDGGDGSGDDPTDSDEEASDDENRVLAHRRIDPLLLDAFLTCGIQQRKARVKFAMAFSTKNNKYIKEVVAKQTAELEAKIEQKLPP